MTADDIYTIAGSAAGTLGDTGDGGPATAALLQRPAGLGIDSTGDLFIADAKNNRIQEVPAVNGTQWGTSMTADDMYTIAGSATAVKGETGDGGPAAAALMSFIMDVSVDSAGNVYVTDWAGNHLREVTADTADTIAAAPGTTSALYPAPGGITITQPGGAQITFYSQSGGTCTDPYVAAGQYCALPEDIGASLTFSPGTGSYTFSPQPGTSYLYNSGGTLQSITDAAGDALTLSYGSPAPGAGNCPASANWCETITSASGRALTLGSNAAGMITSVTDPMGRTWTYAYTSGDLTSVTDPLTHVTSYAYSAGATGNPLNASNLTTITSPNGQTGGTSAGTHTTITYNTAGQVTSQADPMGFTTTYTWTGFNPATGSGDITVSDPDGNKTVYYYAQGTLAAQSAWTGTTLTSEQDDVPDQAITTGDNSAGTQLDTTSTDGNGNITTTHYDPKGNPDKTITPDGSGPGTTTSQSTSLDQEDCSSTPTASSDCAASAGPTPVTAGGTITPPSAVPPQGVTWILYDGHGNALYATTGVFEPGSSTAAYAQTTYQLFTGNIITLGTNHTSCNTTPPAPSLPCATINADDVVTQLAYNAQGDLTSTSTPDGNGAELATTTYSYDADGEQTSETSPDGNLTGANAGNYTTVSAYNSDGQQTSQNQGDGTGHTVTTRTTSYGYDADGNQTSVDDPRGFTTTTAYNADDQATLVTDPSTNKTLTCYDAAGNLTQTVPPTGVAASGLSAASCPAAYPAGYGTRLATDATTYTFDALGNETATTTPAPAGQTGHENTTYAYDANGNLLTITAPPATSGGPNQVTVNTYNDADELATVTTGYGTSAAATISYCYDPNGDRTSVVYPDGNSTGVAPCQSSAPWAVSAMSSPTQAGYQTIDSYDSASELVSTTTPATTAAPHGATTSMTYDPAGNQLTSTDPDGVATTWTYTPLSNAATISYSAASAHSVTYGYDADSNKTAMTDGTGPSSYHYDTFGELTSATNGAGQTTGYGYDADSDVSSIAYPLPATATWATSSTVSYGYNKQDVLNSVTDFNGNTVTIANNGNGLPSAATLGATGDTISYTYDQANRISAVALKNATTTLQSFTYADSPAGAILSETDTPSSSASPAVFTYDAKGRVTSMTPGSGTALNYTFDASSNLTTLPNGANAATGYDSDGELVSATLAGATTAYTYDADGRRLTQNQGTSTIASGTWNGAGEAHGLYEYRRCDDRRHLRRRRTSRHHLRRWNPDLHLEHRRRGSAAHHGRRTCLHLRGRIRSGRAGGSLVRHCHLSRCRLPWIRSGSCQLQRNSDGNGRL